MHESDEKGGRALAIDPGAKRVGIAVSDALGLTAQGLETFETGKGKDFRAHLKGLVERYAARTVIVGLPLSMGGKDIEGSVRSRELAAEIEEQFGIEVVLMDERMTSLEAERILRSGERSFERRDIDKLSAVLLLQSYLDERSSR